MLRLQGRHRQDGCLHTQMRKALWADLQLQGTNSSICMASTSMGETLRQVPRLLRQAGAPHLAGRDMAAQQSLHNLVAPPAVLGRRGVLAWRGRLPIAPCSWGRLAIAWLPTPVAWLAASIGALPRGCSIASPTARGPSRSTTACRQAQENTVVTKSFVGFLQQSAMKGNAQHPCKPLSCLQNARVSSISMVGRGVKRIC